METGGDLVQGEQTVPRLWARRLTAILLEDDLPPIQVQDETPSKSRPSSPTPCCQHFQQEFLEPISDVETCLCTSVEPEKASLELDAASLGDIPACYSVPALPRYEMPVVGLYVDPKVVPNFKYKVRRIPEVGGKEKWLFGGEALELASIGRGYSRRLTFKPPTPSMNDLPLNNNQYYFWSDSNPLGFAFSLEVTRPEDKFTLLDANHLPVGHLEIIRNQGPQEEVGQQRAVPGGVEKTVRVRALCKVDWFHEKDTTDLLLPMSGLCVCVSGKVVRVTGVRVGNLLRRGFTLLPGGDSKLRLTHVTDQETSASYTLTGLESYEMPVVGTYVDERITPGFHYAGRTLGARGKPLFGGAPLELESMGRGYAKRLTFRPSGASTFGEAAPHFWSDSQSDGIALRPSAVRPGMSFAVFADGQCLGEATVFRADAPQIQEKQTTVENNDGTTTVVKRIRVDVTCHVRLLETEPHDMRVSGTATVAKAPGARSAKLLAIDSIGLESQLNLLFLSQSQSLVFYPL